MTDTVLRTLSRRVAAAIMTLALVPSQLWATWSIIAVDARTGRVVIASATCVPQSRLVGFPARDLMDVQAIVVPGVGVAAAQAGVDRTRANQMLIYAELRNGTDPARILELLGQDPDFQRRQFGIVDVQGRMAGFSGAENRPASLSVQGRLPDQAIYYSIQGNILASDDVVYEAARRFMSAEGTLTDRVMAAMEGADEAGGDVRCTCETEPVPTAACHGRNAHVAYILAADASDPVGESFNDGRYAMYISVTDEDIQPHEDANPVLTLRQRYGAWKAARGAGVESRTLPPGSAADSRGNPVELRTADGATVFGVEFRTASEAAPYVLLFHQGGASGVAEYDPIVPRLLAAGFHALVIDQRRGGDRFGGTNRTAAAFDPDRIGYCDALPDLEAALDHARARAPDRRAVLWGSSYSAALVLQLAASRPDDVAAVLSFSPASGEPMAGCQPEDHASRVAAPTLILRPASEMEIERVATQMGTFRDLGFQAHVADPGVHGSSMLVADRVGADVEHTWTVVLSFLEPFAEGVETP